jgi:DNA-directed RNA polymerase subunit RPC12/RpoP
MSEDWRARNAWHLRGLTLQFSQWTRPKPSWDHDHCAGCWAKFSDSDGQEVQRAGYTTGEDYPKGARYEWVCADCFRELKEVMGWITAT